ncbi:hypothetical protein [Brucella sp. 22210]|uniref:hypothetical protein n=1 Tax=Brucella sp. 22210 TaxID=3453892 RepID=UPI003F86233F
MEVFRQHVCFIVHTAMQYEAGRRYYHHEAPQIITDKAIKDGVRSEAGLINHIDYWMKKLRVGRWDGSIG